jgi:hypothetical protein
MKHSLVTTSKLIYKTVTNDATIIQIDATREVDEEPKISIKISHKIAGKEEEVFYMGYSVSEISELITILKNAVDATIYIDYEKPF